jgi:hypothetical protein
MAMSRKALIIGCLLAGITIVLLMDNLMMNSNSSRPDANSQGNPHHDQVIQHVSLEQASRKDLSNEPIKSIKTVDEILGDLPSPRIIPHNKNCDYGLNEVFLEKIRANQQPICANQRDPLNSCTFHRNSEFFCAFENFIIDKSALTVTFKANVFKPEPILNVPHKSLDVANCNIAFESINIFQQNHIELTHKVGEAMQAVFDSNSRLSSSQCAGKWIEDRYLYFFERVAGVNTYHHTMDLYSFWFTMKLYNIPISKTQVVFFDGLQFKVTDVLFESLTNYPAIRFANLTQDGDTSYVCVRNAVFGSSGYSIFPSAVIANYDPDTSPCTYSPLVVEFRDFVVHRLSMMLIYSKSTRICFACSLNFFFVQE